MVQSGKRRKIKSKLCYPVTELKGLIACCSLFPKFIATAFRMVVYMLIGHVSLERIFSSLVRLKSVGEGAQRMQIKVSFLILVPLHWFTLLEELVS